MRVNLRGLNSATKKLADGTQRTYWYAWRGGPLLRGEPGSPEFVASYNAAVAAKVTPPSGVLLRLLQDYQASDNFRSRRDRTRHDYVQKIKYAARAGRLYRSRDRRHHRTQLARCSLNPRCSLPAPRPGTSRLRHHQARKGNENFKLTIKLVNDDLMRT